MTASLDAPKAPSAAPARVGAPVDPRRLWKAVATRRRWMAAIAAVALVTGALVGRFGLHKTYVARSTLLWSPPSVVVDAPRALQTLAQAVKLPSNLRVVREKIGAAKTLEALGASITVELGTNSMLLTISGRADDRGSAALLANATTEVFLTAQRDIARARHLATLNALRVSLSLAQEESRAKRARYEAFLTDHRIQDLSVDVRAAIEEVARLRVAENDARVELSATVAEEDALEQARRALPENVMASRTDKRLDSQKLSELEVELAAARARLTEEHPLVEKLVSQVEALRASTDADATPVSVDVTGRNSLRDTVAAHAEKSRALRKAIESRSKTLSQVKADAEHRAMELTTVQSEAASLLAAGTIAEEHVGALLKQVSLTEDGLREVGTGLQVVSEAVPPDRSEKGLGRIVAILSPLVALLVFVIVIVVRELGRLRIATAKEAAYWASAPVLWSTAWPSGAASEARDLARELACQIEPWRGAIGICSTTSADHAALVASLLAERMRTVSSCRVLAPAEDKKGASADTCDLVDAFDGAPFRSALARARKSARHVLVVLPPAHETAALRAALGLLDGVVLAVHSGASGMFELASLRPALGLANKGVGVVLTHVPQALLGATHRSVGPSFELIARQPRSAPRRTRSRAQARPETAAEVSS